MIFTSSRTRAEIEDVNSSPPYCALVRFKRKKEEKVSIIGKARL